MQMCTDGKECKRRVCFFAHLEHEIRNPEDDPSVAEITAGELKPKPTPAERSFSDPFTTQSLLLSLLTGDGGTVQM